MSPGRLILVSGYAGAGKTTLIRAALKRLPKLHYLRTAVTRPMRPDEQDSPEYDFVTPDEYDSRRRSSHSWDHSEFDGYYYGADIAAVTRQIEQGESFICAVIPDDTYRQMGERYGLKPVVIWIDTPLEVANQRLMDLGNALRARRIHHPLQQPRAGQIIRQLSDIVMDPTGDLSADQARFTALLSGIINNV